ncbi:MAG: deoxyribose-phosphate aldolase [Candidatus Gastranaerophilales bacterium]|nr:deoxyribose-phosphate aldolase [Candidatus Gastranaerophilales bacterium]
MKPINEYIEHTILKPDATFKDVEKVIQEALEYNFLGVCINPNHVKEAKPLLENSNTKLVTVVNFPLANNTIDTILLQTGRALIDGAQEIDTVINLAELKNKNYEKVTYDIKRTKELCGEYVLKVILETDLLTKEEIEIACKCAVDAGANCVKTSTGFVKGGVGAKVEDVKLMYDIVSPHGLFVKASGGIKDYAKAKALVEAGAMRLGTSSGVEIIMGENK